MAMATAMATDSNDDDSNGDSRNRERQQGSQRRWQRQSACNRSRQRALPKAARAEADLSILGILPRIESGGSDGVEAVLCGVHGGKFGRRGQYQFQSVENTCAAIRPDFNPVQQNARKPKRDPAVCGVRGGVTLPIPMDKSPFRRTTS